MVTSLSSLSPQPPSSTQKLGLMSEVPKLAKDQIPFWNTEKFQEKNFKYETNAFGGVCTCVCTHEYMARAGRNSLQFTHIHTTV